MADEDEIREVREMLGSNPQMFGWDDARIGAALDDGDSPNTIARMFWESRMTSQTGLADVSESGSSRALSQIFKNSAAVAAYYRGAEAAEDPDNQPRDYAVSREIRRV